MLEMIVGILMTAIATSVIYIWGLKKSMSQQNDLLQILSIKGRKKVLKYLKKNGQITISEVEKEVNKISASQFYSKRKAVVTEPKVFSKALINEMKENGIITEELDHGKKIYRLQSKD
ncbi:hypothetical protein EDD66_105211 [Mobilisporobacter senegalensis]|uniref:Uncharacterized protein n=1 Tax=Mobilisporobacter senegalensis TaxID=1329262 RepID=A0A3N1XNJ9_9FIRM|nr:hypothetical protein [Mobilisporobacter senegalensis]ROR28270.1 hypothetical protein EDD66_105211 [Mobilisporobacter senegalensis]